MFYAWRDAKIYSNLKQCKEVLKKRKKLKSKFTQTNKQWNNV